MTQQQLFKAQDISTKIKHAKRYADLLGNGEEITDGNIFVDAMIFLQQQNVLGALKKDIIANLQRTIQQLEQEFEQL